MGDRAIFQLDLSDDITVEADNEGDEPSDFVRCCVVVLVPKTTVVGRGGGRASHPPHPC